jgi:hypothetical protein
MVRVQEGNSKVRATRLSKRSCARQPNRSRRRQQAPTSDTVAGAAERQLGSSPSSSPVGDCRKIETLKLVLPSANASATANRTALTLRDARCRKRDARCLSTASVIRQPVAVRRSSTSCAFRARTAAWIRALILGDTATRWCASHLQPREIRRMSPASRGSQPSSLPVPDRLSVAVSRRCLAPHGPSPIIGFATPRTGTRDPSCQARRGYGWA